jgi:hypothetical protein
MNTKLLERMESAVTLDRSDKPARIKDLRVSDLCPTSREVGHAAR